MKTYRITEQFQTVFEAAAKLSRAVDADALMLLLEGPTDWDRLKAYAGEEKILIAADFPAQIEGAAEAGLATVVLKMPDSPVHEKLTQALLESVADDILAPGAQVVALYSGFEAGTIDSISLIHLGEHLGQLTARDLRQLETRVPLDTLKTVVDMAVEVGREGREGKPVGTLFVVGDSRKVLASTARSAISTIRGSARESRKSPNWTARSSFRPRALSKLRRAISTRRPTISPCPKGWEPGTGPPRPSAAKPMRLRWPSASRMVRCGFSKMAK